MKKVLLFVLAVSLVIGVATLVSARIQSTPHDIAPEPCAMCHTPHHANYGYPLWNRVQANQTYAMYESPTFDMSNVTGYVALNGNSKFCMVCHNGLASTLVNYPGPCSTVDPDYDYDMPDGSCAQVGDGPAAEWNPDNDLTNDHPLNFTYDPSADSIIDDNRFPLIDNSFEPRHFIPGEYTGTFYPLFTSVDGADRFECSTCHSVHDTATYPDKGTYQVYFLRTDNTGSAMCMDCHTNK